MATIFLILIFLSYITMGLPDSAWGTAWPFMRSDLLMSLASAGIFTAVVTLCSALSSALVPRIFKNVNTGLQLAVCALITGLTILGISFANNFYVVVALAVPLGLAGGGVDVSINNYVSERFSPRIMNWVHASWGVGSMLGPLIMTAAITSLGSWRHGFQILAGIQLFFALVQFIAIPLWKKNPVPKLEVSEDNISTAHDVKRKRLAIFLSVALYFLYCGAEVSFGYWLNSLLVEQRNFGATLGGACVSVYYGGIMVGRVFMGLVSNKLGAKRTTYVGLALAAVGVGLFFITNSVPAAFISAALIGFGFGPIYPCNMSQTVDRFAGDTAKKVVGYQVASACIGMLVVEPLVGIIMERTVYEALPICIAVIFAFMAVTLIFLNVLTKPRAALPEELTA